MLNQDMFLNPKLFDDDLEQVPTRNGYGEGIVLAAEANSNVVALCADLTESTRTQAFKDKYPDRFIEIGVAEQNLATVASGMAAIGKIPFMTSYAVFSPGRNWEQIRTTICYNNQPVKIVGSHAGISVGPDGATHQALEDMAITRVLPNMVVVSPVDAIQAKKATQALVNIPQPCYLRLSREKVPLVTTDQTPFEVGKGQVFHQGKDVTIIATGQMVYIALLAAKELKTGNISVRVINCHTIKPIDHELIAQAAQETGAIVTMEEHQAHGGLGSAVAEVVCQNYPVPMKIIGIEDRFGESGKPSELLEKFGLTKSQAISAVTQVLKMKRR